jgi:lipopolysaccharide export system protein LptA
VTALIKLNNSNNITITSNFGKYNIDNFDTIFSENVIIEYLDEKITGGYLDFSIKRNSMIISKDIVYTNLENVLKADVMEMNIETKDSKIFMYEDDKKVNIKSIN